MISAVGWLACLQAAWRWLSEQERKMFVPKSSRYERITNDPKVVHRRVGNNDQVERHVRSRLPQDISVVRLPFVVGMQATRSYRSTMKRIVATEKYQEWKTRSMASPITLWPNKQWLAITQPDVSLWA
jgi:hypothetical protein